ncbi:MAG: GNAT family N-acetyltransferase [Chloroflexota bacterium]
MDLQVQFLNKENEADAIAIIKSGLTQHWGSYDPSFNPDVTALFNHYGDRLMTFWQAEKMVGTAAYYPKDAETVFVTRVSVIEHLQGYGIGSRIMSLLEQHVVELGYKFAELETTTNWEPVVNFYLKLGYTVTRVQDEDTYFVKRLHAEII